MRLTAVTSEQVTLVFPMRITSGRKVPSAQRTTGLSDPRSGRWKYPARSSRWNVSSSKSRWRVPRGASSKRALEWPDGAGALSSARAEPIFSSGPPVLPKALAGAAGFGAASSTRNCTCGMAKTGRTSGQPFVWPAAAAQPSTAATQRTHRVFMSLSREPLFLRSCTLTGSDTHVAPLFKSGTPRPEPGALPAGLQRSRQFAVAFPGLTRYSDVNSR